MARTPTAPPPGRRAVTSEHGHAGGSHGRVTVTVTEYSVSDSDAA